MKAKKLFGAFLALGLGLAAVTQAGDAFADKKKSKKELEAEAAMLAANPAEVKTPIALPITGVSFGQSTKQVAVAIDGILDEDYKPLYKQTSPGVKMKQLDAQ